MDTESTVRYLQKLDDNLNDFVDKVMFQLEVDSEESGDLIDAAEEVISLIRQVMDRLDPDGKVK
jgi:glutathionylspermidine synthase